MLLGPYPQLREWPHVGKPPTRSTIRTMRRSSPITLPLRQKPQWLEGRGRFPHGSKPAARFMYGGQAFSPEGSGAGKKKPTWRNTVRCSTTSAYSSTGPPAQAGLPFI